MCEKRWKLEMDAVFGYYGFGLAMEREETQQALGSFVFDVELNILWKDYAWKKMKWNGNWNLEIEVYGWMIELDWIFG